MRVFLAGRVAIEAGEVHVDEARFPGRQGRLVFAYLVLEQGRPAPHEELAEALWGEARPAAWKKALTVLVSKIRGLLAECGIDDEKALTSAFGCYRLDLPDGAWVDVIAAGEAAQEAEDALAAGDPKGAKEAASRAESLARPPFLPGDDGAWVDAKRRELADVLVRALACLAEACSRAGDSVAAVRWAEEAIALEPFQESGYRRLMEVHIAAGNRAEALRVYERCRRLLADELGAFPSPETEVIYRDLLRTPTAAPPAVDGSAAADDALLPLRRRASRRWSGRLRIAGAGALVLAAAVAAVVALTRGGDATKPSLQPDSAIALDSRGNIVASVPVGSGPIRAAVGKDGIWTIDNDGFVWQIDPETKHVAQHIYVDTGLADLAVGDDSVWVTNGSKGTLEKISADRHVDSIPLPNGPRGVAYGLDTVWIANLDDHSVARVDPASDKLVKTIPAGGTPTAVATGLGSVWVTNESNGTVSRINPKTNEVVETINVGGSPSAIAVGSRWVWVVNTLDGTVSRIDPATETVTAVVPVGEGPRDLAVGLDSVWVANEWSGTVSQIDPRTATVVKTIKTGNRPTSVVAAADAVWVTVRAGAGAHRGGVLRMAGADPDSIDPAFSYRTDVVRLLSLTGDGLTAMKRVEGPEGWAIVPDLATSLPNPVDDGKTYTFRLRKGVRFSTGALVEPADVRSSFERLFEAGSPGAAYFGRIVGAAGCAKGRRCNLSRGIVTDAAAGTVAFHLASPDPDFRYKLALSFAFVLPANAARREVGDHPLPATGPYVIASYRPGELKLVRNPHFREWSPAAHPAGYPDEIVVKLRPRPIHGLEAVKQGRLDYIGQVDPAQLHELATQYAGRFHLNIESGTHALYLNTRTAPFDRAAARQAIAFAVDRSEVVSLYGGPLASRPTCQILPPNFPAYERYCPYTRAGAIRGRWSGPDLARAKALIARAGVRAKPVKVIAYRYSAWAPVARYTARLLDRLGFDASAEILDYHGFFARLAKPEGWQIAVLGWAADYPSPGGFIAPVLSCDAPANLTGFCDPKIDAKIERAQALQTTDPQRANALWARIDHELVDRAPWIPLVNARVGDLLSERVGNYQYHPQWGVLLDQLWVR